jgi:hypothetical protein
MKKVVALNDESPYFFQFITVTPELLSGFSGNILKKRETERNPE